MKLYIAALVHNMEYGGSMYAKLPDNEKAIVDSTPNVLESYHYLDNQRKVDCIRAAGKKIFLDSGAFSAFTMGVEINLPKFCHYIRENADIIDCVSVLDGIGDPLKTWQNQWQMEQLGTRPLPCFHYGEDERYLEEYVRNYEYITLGGMVPISSPQLIMWLDRIWDKYLCDGAGRPRIKVHGFGLTSIPLMKRYPWYSVDSSSWVQISSVGSIIIPEWGALAVSNESPNRRNLGQHIDTISPVQREAVIAKVEEFGIPFERIRAEYLARRCYNILAYRKLQDMISRPDPIFQRPQPELFS